MGLNSLDTENKMLPQHSQQPFWLYKYSANMFLFGVRKVFALYHFWTLNNCILNFKANICIFMYISVRNYLFQRFSKILSGKEWVEGRLNNFLRAARCLGLVIFFSIFYFNWNFCKFNFFSTFRHFGLEVQNCGYISHKKSLNLYIK